MRNVYRIRRVTGLVVVSLGCVLGVNISEVWSQPDNAGIRLLIVSR